MRFLILGGTGFVGKALVRHFLDSGIRVTAVVRSVPIDMDERAETVIGNPMVEGSWMDAAAEVDGIVNLVGGNIMTRWTKQAQKLILDSRARSTRLAVQALGESGGKVLLCANAVGFYGDRGDEVLTEASAKGQGFLSDVCQAWQDEAKKALEFGHRVVVARFAAVLGPNGGALAKMLPAFRLGLGGPVGSGKQWFPWVHREDVCRALEFAAQTPQIRGPINICGPMPITNAAFAQALGRALKRPAVLPLPAFVLRLLFGQAASVVLASQRCEPAVLQAAGFTFRFSTAEAALADILTLR